MQVKSETEVAQSRPTLCNPMDCSLPGSSVHGIFQARVLEWAVIAFSRTWKLVGANVRTLKQTDLLHSKKLKWVTASLKR